MSLDGTYSRKGKTTVVSRQVFILSGTRQVGEKGFDYKKIRRNFLDDEKSRIFIVLVANQLYIAVKTHTEHAEMLNAIKC